jgi:transposase
LHRRYEDTCNVESRTRYQMILLAQQNYKVSQMARIVLRREGTVARVLKRFLAAGLGEVPRRTPPGRERRVTVAWESALLRVIELDPQEVGVSNANWTTELLAEYLVRPAHRDTSQAGDGARVFACQWLRLQTTDMDRCLAKLKRKRTMWEKSAGRGRVSRSHSRLHLSPCETWSKLICGVNFPSLGRTSWRCSREPISICRMRCSLPFTPP